MLIEAAFIWTKHSKNLVKYYYYSFLSIFWTAVYLPVQNFENDRQYSIHSTSSFWHAVVKCEYLMYKDFFSHLSIAWRSLAGFHVGSNNKTTLAPTKLRPSPPALKKNHKDQSHYESCCHKCMWDLIKKHNHFWSHTHKVDTRHRLTSRELLNSFTILTRSLALVFPSSLWYSRPSAMQ